VLTATDQKPQKSLKSTSYYAPLHRLNVNVMLSNMTFLIIFAFLIRRQLMDKLKFLVLTFAVLLSKLCSVS